MTLGPGRRVLYLGERSREHFAMLVRATRQYVYAAAKRILGDSGAAEDVSQQVYLRVLTDRSIRPAAVRSGRGFLTSLATSLARSRLRSEARRTNRERVAHDVRASVLGWQLAREELVDIRDAVLALPRELRSCVELRYFGDMRIKDVARTLSLPETTVQERLRRACDRLRATFTPSTMAFVTAVLIGRVDAAWSGVRPPASLSEKLESLGQNGTSPPRRGKTKSGEPRTWASALALATAASIILALFLGWGLVELVAGPGGAVVAFRGFPGQVAGERTPPGGEVKRDGERELPAVARANDPGRQGDGRRAVGEDRARGVVADEPEGVPPPAALEVWVRDRDGRPLRRGELFFELPHGATLSGLLERDDFETLSSTAHAALGERHDLALANPVTIDEFPATLEGVAIGVRLDAPHHHLDEEVECTVERGTTTVVELVAVRWRRLEVAVLDATTGEPIVGARVSSRAGRFAPARGSWPSGVVIAGSPATPAETSIIGEATTASSAVTTDGSGIAVLERLGEGEHTVQATARGYMPATARAPVGERALELRLTPFADQRPGSVTVTVLDDAGTPRADIDIVATVSTNSAELVELEGTTAEDGTVHFDAVPAGIFGASVRDEHHRRTRTVIVRPGEHARAFIGRRLGEASADFTLDRPTLEWASRVDVFLSGPGSYHAAVERRTASASFEEVVAGTYEVRVVVTAEVEVEVAGSDAGTEKDQPPETRTAQTTWTLTERVELGAGRRQRIRLPISPAVITGQVRLTTTDAPAPLVNVTLEGTATAETMTDRTGRYIFIGAPRGKYRLAAPHRTGATGTPTEQEIFVPHGAHPEPIDLAIEPVKPVSESVAETTESP